MAPSSTGQAEQGTIAAHNKNAEIVIFELLDTSSPPQHPAVCLALVGGSVG